MATDSERAKAWDMYVAMFLYLGRPLNDAVPGADVLLGYRDERFGDGNEKPVVKAEEPAAPEIPLCPWCEGKCKVESARLMVWVYCTRKGCEAVGPTKATVADAITAWNSVRG